MTILDHYNIHYRQWIFSSVRDSFGELAHLFSIQNNHKQLMKLLIGVPIHFEDELDFFIASSISFYTDKLYFYSVSYFVSSNLPQKETLPMEFKRSWLFGAATWLDLQLYFYFS